MLVTHHKNQVPQLWGVSAVMQKLSNIYLGSSSNLYTA